MANFKRLRVCLISEFFYPDESGGTAITTSQLARKLVDECDVELDVVTGRHTYQRGKERLAAVDRWDGIRIFRVAAPNWNKKKVPIRALGNLLLSLSVAKKLLSRPKYDVILTTTAPPLLPTAASLLKRFRHTPYAYLIFDLEPERTVSLGVASKSSGPVRMLSSMQKRWLHGAAKVISIGRCMTEKLAAAYSLPADKIRTVVWGAELDTCNEACQARGKPADAPFTILYSGNLGRYHDFDAVLDSAKALLADREFRFVIVGKGAKRDHIADRIATESLSNVELRDFLPAKEYGELLRDSDVCLVTMEKGIEGTCVPSKVYSILAAGRPVLAVIDPTCETGLTIQEYGCGVCVPQENAEALTDTLRDLRAHPERVAAMAECSLQASLSHFTLSRVATDIHKVLLECTYPGRLLETVAVAVDEPRQTPSSAGLRP